MRQPFPFGAQHQPPPFRRGEGQIGQPESGQAVTGRGVVAGGGQGLLGAQHQVTGTPEFAGQVGQEGLPCLLGQDIEAAPQRGQQGDELVVGDAAHPIHQGDRRRGRVEAGQRGGQQPDQPPAQGPARIRGGGVQPRRHPDGGIVVQQQPGGRPLHEGGTVPGELLQGVPEAQGVGTALSDEDRQGPGVLGIVGAADAA